MAGLQHGRVAKQGRWLHSAQTLAVFMYILATAIHDSIYAWCPQLHAYDCPLFSAECYMHLMHSPLSVHRLKSCKCLVATVFKCEQLRGEGLGGRGSKCRSYYIRYRFYGYLSFTEDIQLSRIYIKREVRILYGLPVIQIYSCATVTIP